LIRDKKGFLLKNNSSANEKLKALRCSNFTSSLLRPFREHSLTGFTLVELMIVVTVLSILSVIALPKFAGMVQRAQEGRTKGNLGIFRSAINIYYADNENNWPYTSVIRTLSDGAGEIAPSDWDFFAPEYLPEIPAVYTGQGGAWGSDHEGKNRICVAWAKNGSSPVVQDAIAGLAHPENGYEYIYYACQSPSDGTSGVEAKVWLNCQLSDSKGKKIIFW
jgi:prepilin-type N-terminal cleavage/methylation domain-containing protein